MWPDILALNLWLWMGLSAVKAEATQVVRAGPSTHLVFQAHLPQFHQKQRPGRAREQGIVVAPPDERPRLRFTTCRNLDEYVPKADQSGSAHFRGLWWVHS